MHGWRSNLPEKKKNFLISCIIKKKQYVVYKVNAISVI